MHPTIHSLSSAYPLYGRSGAGANPAVTGREAGTSRTGLTNRRTIIHHQFLSILGTSEHRLMPQLTSVLLLSMSLQCTHPLTAASSRITLSDKKSTFWMWCNRRFAANKSTATCQHGPEECFQHLAETTP